MLLKSAGTIGAVISVLRVLQEQMVCVGHLRSPVCVCRPGGVRESIFSTHFLAQSLPAVAVAVDAIVAAVLGGECLKS